MTVVEYVAKALTAWATGFFPFAEIYVAVPVALALGLDDISSIAWPALGNIAPLFLINYGYEWLQRFSVTRRLLRRITSRRALDRVKRHGPWLILLLTPWIGVWAVAAGAKLLGMPGRPLILAASVSIIAYAIVLVVAIRTGIGLLS